MSAHRYWRVRVIEAATTTPSAAEIEFRGTVGGANLATGGTPIAGSNFSGFPASAAFDGNAATAWAAANLAGAWIGYDFGVGNAVEIWELAWRSRDSVNTQNPTLFLVEASNNGTEWTPVPAWIVQDSSAWSNGQQKTYERPSTSPESDRWRLRITPQSGGFTSCAELALRGESGGANLATGGTPSASSTFSGSFAAANAFDGNTATIWASQNLPVPHWLAYEFTDVVKISELVWTARGDAAPEQNPSRLLVQYWDGSDWRPAWLVQTIPSWSTGQSRTFTSPYPDIVGEVTSPLPGDFVHPAGAEIFSAAFLAEWGEAEETEDLTYRLEISSDSGDTWSLLADGLTESNFEVSVSGRAASSSYRLRVRSEVPDQTESDWVTSAPFSISQAPSTPGAFTVQPSTPLDRSPFTFQWGASVDGNVPPLPLTYEVEAQVDGGDWAAHSTSPTPSASFNPSVVGEGVWKLRVRAKNGFLSSAWRESASFTVVHDFTPPSRPGPVDARWTGELSALLEFEPFHSPVPGDTGQIRMQRWRRAALTPARNILLTSTTYREPFNAPGDAAELRYYIRYRYESVVGVAGPWSPFILLYRGNEWSSGTFIAKNLLGANGQYGGLQWPGFSFLFNLVPSGLMMSYPDFASRAERGTNFLLDAHGCILVTPASWGSSTLEPFEAELTVTYDERPLSNLEREWHGIMAVVRYISDIPSMLIGLYVHRATGQVCVNRNLGLALMVDDEPLTLKHGVRTTFTWKYEGFPAVSMPGSSSEWRILVGRSDNIPVGSAVLAHGSFPGIIHTLKTSGSAFSPIHLTLDDRPPPTAPTLSLVEL